jgi:hypothetical protein
MKSKIWDSTRICDSGRISGATDKGMTTKAHDVSTPEAYSGSGPWIDKPIKTCIVIYMM